MKKLFNKYREIIVYVIFGGLTTLVNYLIYFPLRHFDVNYVLATTIAWAGAVLFAYVVNKIFVFKSRERGLRALREFLLFVGARVFSYGAEVFIMYMFIDVMHIDSFVWREMPVGELIAKTVAQVIIVILNYVFSKLVIFRKKK